MVGNGKVESHASCLETDKKDLHPRVVLESFKYLVKNTCRGAQVAGQPLRTLVSLFSAWDVDNAADSRRG